MDEIRNRVWNSLVDYYFKASVDYIGLWKKNKYIYVNSNK